MDGQYLIQNTLNDKLTFTGIGLHSGVASRIELLPAPPNHGIAFQRTDVADCIPIPARYPFVVKSENATTLALPSQPEFTVSTVEHLLAALYSCGIQNLLIQVNGPELPILDGSAKAYIEGFQEVGLSPQPFTNSILKVTKPIRIHQKGSICELLPRDRFRLTTSVDFPHPKIGLQTCALELSPQKFSESIASARTFGFLKDLEYLKSHHLALGASLENVLAFSDDDILNPSGARFEDECARHKLLDAIGDLSLCGSWLLAEMVSFRAGHAMHLALLKELFRHPNHFEFIPAESLSAPLQTTPAMNSLALE